MHKKRGSRKAQVISTDFITAFTIYFIAFSIFSYYVFSVEDSAFTERSFLKDTHYSFDIFEENLMGLEIDIGGNYHLNNITDEIEDLNYTTLKDAVLNNTQFESDKAAIDVCVYLTDKSEKTYFNAGPGSGNITLAGQKCGAALFPISPFPACGSAYSQGFSAVKLYFYSETQKTARLIIHFCKR